jgi:hypothetical protein
VTFGSITAEITPFVYRNARLVVNIAKVTVTQVTLDAPV